MASPEAASAHLDDAQHAPAGWVSGHPEDGLLHAGLDDQLSPAESARVADHVSRCANCRSRVAEAHGLIAVTRRIVTRTREVPEGASPMTEELATALSATRVGETDNVATSVQATVHAESDVDPVSQANAAPAIAESVAAASAAVAPTTLPTLGTVARPVPVASAAKPAKAARTRKPSTFPWARARAVAAAVAVIGAGIVVARTMNFDAPPERVAITPSAPPPAPQPDTLGVADGATHVGPVAAMVTGNANGDTTTAESANGALDTRADAVRQGGTAIAATTSDSRTRPSPAAAPFVAAFDSLVLTQKGCASQCDETTLYLSSMGAIHYVVRAANGVEHVTDASAADAALRRMSGIISSLLFETAAVPVSGRSVCTVFDSAHIPTLRLMVAHGSSRALHENSCSAAPKELHRLAAQLDSLSGSARLQKSALQAER